MTTPTNSAMFFIDGSNLLIEMGSVMGVKLRAEKASTEALNLASQSLNHSQRELFSAYFPTHRIVRKYWFGSVQGSDEDLEDTKLALRNFGFEGSLFRKIKGKDEKGVDLAVAREMLMHGFRRNYDLAVVVAGDEDYLGLIEDVKRLGLTVVGMFFETAALSKRLRVAVDHFQPLYSPEPIQPALAAIVKGQCAS